ncbi:MAG: trigger factor [Brachymonas sp.]
MAVTVETLEKLERKITLTVPTADIAAEVEKRLRRTAKQVKLDGFRPGKAPMSVVAQRYGYSTQFEVINDKIGQAFYEAAQEAGLRVAGQPSIAEQEGTPPEGQLVFDAKFEVFPDVKLGDLAAAEVEVVSVAVDEDAINRTIDILRQQRQTFAQRAADAAAQAGDRVTVDFVGKIDGEEFAGGKAEDFSFALAKGQMLKEFDDAVLGMKTGESKTFPLSFPADYHGQDVAGKQADFMVTVNKIEEAKLPEVDDAFAKSLHIADGTVAGLRADIQSNLAREVKFRVQARNKSAVLDAIAAQAELDLPNSVVTAELAQLVAGARADLKARGIPDADKAPIPEEIFRPQAERRVRLGLIVAELVEKNSLHATEDQVQAHVQELAGSYEKPAEVVRWYLSDAERVAEVRAAVTENNVTEFALKNLKKVEKALSFEELMGQQAA